jgi:hypothetical protein
MRAHAGLKWPNYGHRRLLPPVATGHDVVATYGPKGASHQALSAICSAALRRIEVCPTPRSLMGVTLRFF